MIPSRTIGRGRGLARAALAALLAPLAALAGVEGVIKTTVAPLSDTVTYSIPGSNPLVTYIGYEVGVRNDGGNTVNAVRFRATTASLVDGQAAVFSSVEGGSCVATNAAGTAVECSIGQLRAGQAAAPFRLFFTAPARASGNPLGNGSVAGGACTGGDCITLDGETYYAEGNTGGNPLFNSVDDWAPVAVALGTANPTRVKSAVPKAGGNFFTGNGGLASASDKFASTVKVPGAPGSTTAEILETPFDLVAGCVNFVECYASDINVPTPAGAAAFDPYLSITIRIDASNLRPGAKIASIVPTYNGEAIGLCAAPTVPRSDNKPCIASRTAYGKGNNVPADLRGDFDWVFINLVNGTYRLP